MYICVCARKMKRQICINHISKYPKNNSSEKNTQINDFLDDEGSGTDPVDIWTEVVQAIENGLKRNSDQYLPGH